MLADPEPYLGRVYKLTGPRSQDMDGVAREFSDALNREIAASAKHAVAGLTKSLAVRWSGKGIVVNCIAPGYLEGTRATANLDAVYRERARNAALLKRAADKDDVANQVVALCQTDSITGQTLVIDAGRFFH